MHEWTNDQMSEWMNKQKNEWTNKWMNKQMNEWTNDQMNDCTGAQQRIWTMRGVRWWRSGGQARTAAAAWLKPSGSSSCKAPRYVTISQSINHSIYLMSWGATGTQQTSFLPGATLIFFHMAYGSSVGQSTFSLASRLSILNYSTFFLLVVYFVFLIFLIAFFICIFYLYFKNL